jgi:hypothetical protein
MKMADDILVAIHEDVKEIKKDVSEVKVNLAVMQLDVKHHVKRSDMLEDLVQHLDETRIQPIEKQLAELKGARKGIYNFIGLLIAFGAMVAAFLLLKH